MRQFQNLAKSRDLLEEGDYPPIIPEKREKQGDSEVYVWKNIPCSRVTPSHLEDVN